MAANQKQEILPPEPPQASGRGKGWASGGPSPNPDGRPPGVANGFTRTVRDGIKAALDNMGGAENYFTYLAATRPDLFTALVGRAMPLKIVGDDAEVYTVQRIERVIVRKK